MNIHMLQRLMASAASLHCDNTEGSGGEAGFSCACSSCRVSLKTGSRIYPVEEHSKWWCRRLSAVEEEEKGRSYNSHLAVNCSCSASKKQRRVHHKP